MPIVQEIFNVELLRQGGFPFLDEDGIKSCREESRAYGTRRYIANCARELEPLDENLFHLLTNLGSQIGTGDEPPTPREKRSFLHGGAFVHHTLTLQADTSNRYNMPIVSKREIDPLLKDLEADQFAETIQFIMKYDPKLAAAIGGIIGNERALQLLQLDKTFFTWGCYVAFFALASEATYGNKN